MSGDSSVEEQISAWSSTRPAWQQRLLRKISNGEAFDKVKLEEIADELVDGTDQSSIPLDAEDVLSTLGSTPTVALRSIRETSNVNALLDAEELTFGTSNLTIVYGDNASGKSGYARILKSVAGSLHREPVHTNVFSSEADQEQYAEIAFESDGKERDSTWPDDVSEELQGISFYDKACGDIYVSTDSELTYRPSALVLLDRLVYVCDEVRAILEGRLTRNQDARTPLPVVPEASDAASFLQSLTGKTTLSQVNKACLLENQADVQLKLLRQEEARLQSTDPEKERSRLRDLAKKTRSVSLHLKTIRETLSKKKVQKAIESGNRAIELRAAATIASGETFESEPVPGVGTETWRSMWQAAREFSETEAYHDHEFPVTEGNARCVLCQQELSSQASERLFRFEAFIRDKTSQLAASAEATLKTTREGFLKLESMPSQIAADLVHVEADDPTLAQSTKAWLELADQRRSMVLARLDGDANAEIPHLDSTLRAKLKTLADALDTAASEIDDTRFTDLLAQVVQKRTNLEGRMAITKQKNLVLAEIERLKQRGAIEAAKHETDTTAITRETTRLTKEHVTAAVHERFKQESADILLEQVELKSTGGRKGKFRQRPSLLGTETTTPLKQVLSEGEQTALGLAGFFTEAYFDASKSALVLDDPVTSLDHVRRSKVANRIIEFARERQVIVFTHNITFVGDLAQASSEHGITVVERGIERMGGKTPGKVIDAHPWKAKDVDARFHELGRQLARLKRERPNWGQEEYERECSGWAGLLSETWERLVNLEIIWRIVDPATSEVRPRMFKVLSHITAEDNKEFQESYSRCSQWARRHDKSPETNYVAPEPAVLQKELDLICTFHARIKKYRNKE